MKTCFTIPCIYDTKQRRKIPISLKTKPFPMLVWQYVSSVAIFHLLSPQWLMYSFEEDFWWGKLFDLCEWHVIGRHILCVLRNSAAMASRTTLHWQPSILYAIIHLFIGVWIRCASLEFSHFWWYCYLFLINIAQIILLTHCICNITLLFTVTLCNTLTCSVIVDNMHSRFCHYTSATILTVR